MSNKKAFVPVLSKHLITSVDALAKLIHNTDATNYYIAWAKLLGAYLFDEYIPITLPFLDFTKAPGTISKYKSEEISTEIFLEHIKDKLPSLQHTSDEVILDAWNTQSIPSLGTVQIYCDGAKQGSKFIFVSYTNPSQYEAFLNTVEESCSEFHRDAHFHAVSYKSDHRYTAHEDLAQEEVERSHLEGDILYSCHNDITELAGVTLVPPSEDNLENCLASLG